MSGRPTIRLYQIYYREVCPIRYLERPRKDLHPPRSKISMPGSNRGRSFSMSKTRTKALCSRKLNFQRRTKLTKKLKNGSNRLSGIGGFSVVALGRMTISARVGEKVCHGVC